MSQATTVFSASQVIENLSGGGTNDRGYNYQIVQNTTGFTGRLSVAKYRYSLGNTITLTLVV